MMNRFDICIMFADFNPSHMHLFVESTFLSLKETISARLPVYNLFYFMLLGSSLDLRHAKRIVSQSVEGLSSFLRWPQSQIPTRITCTD